VITAAPVSPRGTLAADIAGGVTTFFTMAYIVVVNPGILSTAGTGMTFSGVLTATVLVASTMTLLMGVYARLPFAVAPGRGFCGASCCTRCSTRSPVARARSRRRCGRWRSCQRCFSCSSNDGGEHRG